MSQGVGLYGGSFDPIHFGHLIGARSIAEQLGLARIFLIPSARPPHKREHVLTEPGHRLDMARLAVQGDPLFEVDDLELHRQGPSYTFDTVSEYRRRLGEAVELCWIIGADSLPELPTWYRIADLVKVVRIVTTTRPGWRPPNNSLLEPTIGPESTRQLLRDCLPTPGIEISSTDIRARVRSSRPIRYLVPASVASHIQAHCLYRE